MTFFQKFPQKVPLAPVEPEDPLEPEEPVEPVEPLEPLEPEPVEPEDPLEPLEPDPVEPDDPLEPEDPLEPDPVEPEDPLEPEPELTGTKVLASLSKSLIAALKLGAGNAASKILTNCSKVLAIVVKMLVRAAWASLIFKSPLESASA